MKVKNTFSMLVLAACAGWTLAVAFEEVSRPYLATVCAGTILVGAGFRMVDASRLRWLAAGETLAVIAVPLGVYAIGSVTGPLAASSLLAGLIASFAVWLIAAITITDIEAVTEPTDLVEGVSGALGRVTTRLLLVGMALMIAIVAGHGGLAPVTTARTVLSGLVPPFLLYWLVGLSGLASLNRSRLLARWKRDRSKIDGDFGQRWRTAAALWLLAATTLAVAMSVIARPVLDLAHTIVANGLGRLADLLARSMEGDPPLANPSGGSQTVVTPPPTTAVNPVTPPPQWFDLFLLLAAGAIFAFAFVVFRRRVKARGASPSRVLWSALKAMWKTLWGMLKELGLMLWSLFRGRTGRDKARDRGRGAGPVPSPGWTPTDPWRRRIAGEYRAFLSAARRRSGPLPVAETPSELARRIEAADPDNPSVGVLTGIYELARFSEHSLDESIARQAHEARLAIMGRWEQPG